MSPSNHRFGVSPAFSISTYGNHFTPENVCEAMERINPWGFTNIQIEIFDNEKIELWLVGDATKRVYKVAKKLGMNISQLVGHLLIDDCASPSALFSNSGIETMEKLVAIANGLGIVKSITLPIGKYSYEEREKNESEQFTDDAIMNRLSEKLYDFYRPVEAAGYRLAVELLPKNIVGGYPGFAQIQKNVALNRFGLLFDTGHAWAASEDIYSIPQQFMGSIFGTHLCDNYGDESLKLAPGEGSINWEMLITNLKHSRYPGFLDIEIICTPDKVEDKYRSSLDFLMSLIL